MNCEITPDASYEDTINKEGMNIWVADTGATCHMGCAKTGMSDTQPSNVRIKVGNGEKLGGNTTGDINVIYIDKTQERKLD